MNVHGTAVAAAAIFAATLAGFSHAADIAWHATSVDTLRRGQNSETRTKAVFSSGEQADITGYGTNHAEANGTRPISGMALIRFDDLSAIVLKSESKYDAGTHESVGAGEFVGGTGRFLGITGKVDCVTRYRTHDSWETDCSGSYALPAR